MLKIDTVLRDTNLPQVKAKLAQAGINNFSVYELDSGPKSSRPSFYVPRSKIEIICKSSQKDSVFEAITDSGERGIIYVSQLTPVITLNPQD